MISYLTHFYSTLGLDNALEGFSVGISTWFGGRIAISIVGVSTHERTMFNARNYLRLFQHKSSKNHVGYLPGVGAG